MLSTENTFTEDHIGELSAQPELGAPKTLTDYLQDHWKRQFHN